MTQDQCLDNGHQATSNNHSTNDQVSDDLNNAKNSFVSNGVNSAVQEFNVDVNSKRSEYRADVAIVQNRAAEIDADCQPSSKVFATSDQPAATSSDIVNLSVNSNRFTIAPDLNKSECKNNILLPDMTVITHQNSSENIRDIIANSDQVHKDAIDSQLTEVSNNVKSEQNSENGNSVDRSGGVNKKLTSSKRERNNKDESDKPEDPVARLNKLRASISSALSEVKGVLKQYSTEQSLDGENESTPSLQPAEDGPVRFRFVRKVRRRSEYSEDDTAAASQKNEINQEIKPETKNTLINSGTKQDDNKILPDDDAKSDNERTSSTTEKTELVSDKVFNISKGNHVPDQPKDTQEIKKDSIHLVQIAEETQVDKTLHSEQNEAEASLIETKSPPQADKKESEIITAPIAGNCHATNLVDQTPPTEVPEEGKQPETSTVGVSNQIKQSPQTADPSVPTIAAGITVIKAKTVKLKKVVKKDRRASIAALEANQVLPDKSISQVVLKTQRRPSDSGTLVKQPPPVKQKPKISEKSKSLQQRPPRAAAISKAEEPAAPAPNVSISQQSQLSISSEKSLEPSPNKTILPTTDHEKVLATKLNEPPPPMQQDSTAVIKKQVPAVSELKLLPDIQPQSKITSSTATHDEIPVTESKETPAKVEDPPTTQTVNEPNQMAVVKASAPVAVKSQPKSGSETSIVNKAKKSAESNDKPTKITALLPANQNKDDQSMPTSENTTVPDPKETEVHTATEVPQPFGDVPSDETANESNPPDQTKADDHMWFKEDDTLASKCETQPDIPSAPPKKKRKAKRKVVIRRIKRKLSKDDTFIHTQEAPAELEIEEKEIEEKDPDDEEGGEPDIVPKQRKPCLKARQFEIGDVVMYAERYKKTQVKWKKAIVMERITSISYKLDIDGEEKPAHISYIKKFTDRKVNFGGKEYLEIDYAQIEEDEEKERNYSIWNLV